MKPKPKKYRKSRNTTPSSTTILEMISLPEEFSPYRGSSTGVVARVESLQASMAESARQVEGLFESLLAEAFS
jgi:hypothetical protein